MFYQEEYNTFEVRQMGRIRNAWQESELDIIKEVFPQRGVAACAELIPRHTAASIAKKAQDMQIGCDLVAQRLYLGLKFHSTEKGVTLHKCGYRCIRISGRWELEHHYIMERQLGRRLTGAEVVHHIDGNKLNNDPRNLELHTRSSHAKHHYSRKRRYSPTLPATGD